MKKILLLDDEQELLETVSGFISASYPDVDIKQINDSVDALIEITEEQYNLVITDHKMPKMLGTEFLYNMKNLSSSKNKNTPIIILSGFIPEVEKLLPKSEEMVLVQKPFNPEKFREILDKFLND